MDDLADAFADDLFGGEDEDVAGRRQARIAAAKAEAASYIARIDKADRLDGDADAIAAALASSADLPPPILRDLTAMCNRLYALRRYVECLRAVLNFLQWHARAAGAATASDTIEPMDDAELADLAMRASRRCETTSAIQAGAQVARASRRMWISHLGLALSAADCFARAGQSRDAAMGYAHYLLQRGANHGVAASLMDVLSKLPPDATAAISPSPASPEAEPSAMPPLDVDELLSRLDLPDADRDKLARLLSQALIARDRFVDPDVSEVQGEYRERRSVRQL